MIHAIFILTSVVRGNSRFPSWSQIDPTKIIYIVGNHFILTRFLIKCVSRNFGTILAQVHFLPWVVKRWYSYGLVVSPHVQLCPETLCYSPRVLSHRCRAEFSPAKIAAPKCLERFASRETAKKQTERNVRILQKPSQRFCRDKSEGFRKVQPNSSPKNFPKGKPISR